MLQFELCQLGDIDEDDFEHPIVKEGKAALQQEIGKAPITF
jgi:hypothetical protein